MAFRFRLEKVLKYRQLLVDRQAVELASAGRKVSELSIQIQDLNDRIHGFEGSFTSSQQQVSISDRMNMAHWIEHLRTQCGELDGDLAEAIKERESQREIMTKAWQDLEVLKKLRAHQKEAWAEDIRKKESLELDEVGIQRSDRRRREKLASV